MGSDISILILIIIYSYNSIAITFIGRKINFESQSMCQIAFSNYDRYGFFCFVLKNCIFLLKCDDVFCGNPGSIKEILIPRFLKKVIKIKKSSAGYYYQTIKSFCKDEMLLGNSG